MRKFHDKLNYLIRDVNIFLFELYLLVIVAKNTYS